MQTRPAAIAPLWKRLVATVLIDVPLVLIAYVMEYMTTAGYMLDTWTRQVVVPTGQFLEWALRPLVGEDYWPIWRHGVSPTAYGLGWLFWLVMPSLLLWLLYFTVGYRLRQTLGKRLMGIAVVRRGSDQRPGWRQAFVRAVALLPSWFGFYIILTALMAAAGLAALGSHEPRTETPADKRIAELLLVAAVFGAFFLIVSLPSLAILFLATRSPDRRGWHDRLAGTTVVESSPRRQEQAPPEEGPTEDAGTGTQAKS
ncbi:MAG: RDD family protein [Dehalococcoidia bacterium]|nr:RDD family protein [Dehalococcoidia bacterium]